MKKFLIISLSALFIIIGTTVCLQLFFNKGNEFNTIYFAAPFVMIITAIFHAILIKGIKTNSKIFINRFLGSSGLKMMLYLIIIILYIFVIQYQAKSFLISFLISYFIFTTIEIITILNFLKK